MDKRIKDNFTKWHNDFMQETELNYDQVIIDDDINVLGNDIRHFTKTMRDFFKFVEDDDNEDIANQIVFSFETAYAEIYSLDKNIEDIYGITKSLYTGLIESGFAS